MNMPKRASRHQFMRASLCSLVSVETTAGWAARPPAAAGPGFAGAVAGADDVGEAARATRAAAPTSELETRLSAVFFVTTRLLGSTRWVAAGGIFLSRPQALLIQGAEPR